MTNTSGVVSRKPNTPSLHITFPTPHHFFLSFLQEDPGRQIFTGSFNPIDYGEWSEQAYIKPITKLFNAIAVHDRPAVAQFIKTHADSTNPKTRDHLGRTPLQFALLCSAEDIAIDLIDAGARMTARVVDGRTGLHLACQMDLERVVKKMLEVSEKNRLEAEEKEKLEKEKKKAEEDKDGDVAMDQQAKDEEDRIRASSEDDWSSEDVDMTDSDDENAKKKKKVNEDGEKVHPAGDALEDGETDEPDVLELDAPDWDQSLTALGVSANYLATL